MQGRGFIVLFDHHVGLDRRRGEIFHVLRHAIRARQFTSHTAGQCPGYAQGNLAILTREDANDFLRFCQANPKPCPILGMSEPGDPRIPAVGKDLDIRTDTLVGHQSRVQLILDLARRERLTLRQLHRRLAGARGHHTFAGTALEVADELEEWFTQGAADGFNLMPPYLPGALNDFVDQVLPILQKRGLFRTEYSGSTLREHYGLARPSNKFHRLISHEIAVA